MSATPVPAAPAPTVADLYAYQCLLALAYAAEIARLHRQIADLTDQRDTARCTLPAPTTGRHTTDAHLNAPKGDR